VGITDELRGQRPVGFVVLKDGQGIDEKTLENESISLIRDKIGAVAFYRNTVLVKRLPKTRSGKILRKVMRQLADNEHFTVPSTIDDPMILDEIKQKLIDRKIGNVSV
jgi:propionyl-CoA synthetase